MKTQSKILIRSLTSYLMLFTGMVIVLWFVFVVVTSVLGLRYYSRDSIETMFFLLFMALVIIGIALTINVSLSIDLIAEAKIRELNIADKKSGLGKKIAFWGFGVVCVLVVVVIIGDFLINRSNKKELATLTKEVVKAHQGNLEQIFNYLEDTSQILQTKEVLTTVSRSSDQVSSAEALLLRDVLGKESIVSFSSGTDSGNLAPQSFENLVIVPNPEEKQLLQELFSKVKTGAQVLEFGKGEIRGYYPISKGDQVMFIRVYPSRDFRGVGGRK